MLTGCVLAALQAGVPAAQAQESMRDRLTGFYLFSSRLDAYGNASDAAPLYRPLTIYQNPAQSKALQLQNLGLRPQRRGGLMPFSLPGDHIRRPQDLVAQTPLVPFLNEAKKHQADRIRAVRSYGGFGERSKTAYQSEIQRAFARRFDLIEATADTAPVFRANLRHASVAGMLATIDTTPFDERGTDVNPETALVLPKALETSVESSHRTTMKDAWDLFKSADYRGAMRTFESAEILEPDDTTARIGGIFSLIAVGSYNAALTELRLLDQDDPNVFLNPIDVAAKLDDRQRVAAMRVQTRTASDAPRERPELAGLHAFVLWYFGDHQEALSIAQAIAQESPNAAYAQWAHKMNAALEASTSGSTGR